MTYEDYYKLRKNSNAQSQVFFNRIFAFKEYLENTLKVNTEYKFNKYRNLEDYAIYLAKVIFFIKKRLNEEEDFDIEICFYGNNFFSIGLEKKGNITAIDSQNLKNKNKLPNSYFNGIELITKDYYKEKDTIVRSPSGNFNNKKSGYFKLYKFKLKDTVLYKKETIFEKLEKKYKKVEKIF
jgi:hypothetical protein